MSPRVSSPRYPAEGDGSLPTLREPRYSQSLERGLAILGCYSHDTPFLGIADIADELGMSRSTTHRYVITLVALGFLEQPPNNSRKYRLGPRGSDIGSVALNSMPLRVCARPILEELRQRVSYTVSIAILDGDEIRFMDRLRGFRGHAKLKLDLGSGSRLPAHCTSMGKVLLANLPDEERQEVIGGLTLRKTGPNTITKKKRLATELEQVREAGFAVADEELKVGVHSIAVPVRGDTGKVIAAVNIAAPTSMIPRTQLVNDFGPHLLAAAELISAALGCPADTDELPKE